MDDVTDLAHLYSIVKANLNGISRTIRFDHHSSERKQPVLYNVVDIGPSLVAKVSSVMTSILSLHLCKRHTYTNCPSDWTPG